MRTGPRQQEEPTAAAVRLTRTRSTAACRVRRRACFPRCAGAGDRLGSRRDGLATSGTDQVVPVFPDRLWRTRRGVPARYRLKRTRLRCPMPTSVGRRPVARIAGLVDQAVQVSVGTAQSPWSLPLPSPASPTSRSSTCAPVTSIGVAACPPLIVGVPTSVFPSAETLRSPCRHRWSRRRRRPTR